MCVPLKFSSRLLAVKPKKGSNWACLRSAKSIDSSGLQTWVCSRTTWRPCCKSSLGPTPRDFDLIGMGAGMENLHDYQFSGDADTAGLVIALWKTADLLCGTEKDKADPPSSITGAREREGGLDCFSNAVLTPPPPAIQKAPAGGEQMQSVSPTKKVTFPPCSGSK